MATSQTTIIPHNQQPLITRTYPEQSELDTLIKNASEAQKTWSKVPLKERIAIGRKFMVSYLSTSQRVPVHADQNEFRGMSDEIPMELTMQMGRSSSHISYYFTLISRFQ